MPCVDATNGECIADTRRWLERAVIGLNLCPFAKSVYHKKQIRYAVTAARTADELLAELAHEMELLIRLDPKELDTTLLIHPLVMTDFRDYHFFLAETAAAVKNLGFDGDTADRQSASRLRIHRHCGGRHRQLHQPFTASDTAYPARGEHRPRGSGFPRRRHDLRQKYRNPASPWPSRLATTMAGETLSARPGQILNSLVALPPYIIGRRTEACPLTLSPAQPAPDRSMYPQAT